MKLPRKVLAAAIAALLLSTLAVWLVGYGKSRGLGSAAAGHATNAPAGSKPTSRPAQILASTFRSARDSKGLATGAMEPRPLLTLSPEDWAHVARGSKARQLAERVRRSKPLIKQVRTNGAAVCAGEEITVEAEVDGHGAPVRTWINGSPENPALLHLHQPGRRFVYIRAETLDAGAADVKRIELQVKECENRPMLMISAKASMEHDPTVIVTVHMVKDGSGAHIGDALNHFTFRYEFGDGAVEESANRSAQHTYDIRKASGSRPVHYIRVTATDRQGSQISTRVAYSFDRRGDTPRDPPRRPDWVEPSDPSAAVRRLREAAERAPQLAAAFRSRTAAPPPGPLGAEQAWAKAPVAGVPADGVIPR